MSYNRLKKNRSAVLYAAMLLVALIFASCGKRVLLDETHPFAGNIWMRFEPEQYDVKVKNIDVPYLITVSLQYDTTFITGEALPLVVEFYADSNARHTIFPDIRLFDRSGMRRGTKVDRYYTVVDTIDRCRLFNEEGTYTYRIKQRTSKYQIGGVVSLGMQVKEL